MKEQIETKICRFCGRTMNGGDIIHWICCPYCGVMFIKNTHPITERQRMVMAFIYSYICGHGYSPSYNEIQTMLGGKTKSTVFQHLHALQDKGYINILHGVSGGITILRSDF